MPIYEGNGGGGLQQRWVPGEIVVVQRDLPLVKWLLQQRLGFFQSDGDQRVTVDTSRSLGLARMKFASMNDVVAKIKAQFATGDRQPGTRTAQALASPDKPVELLLGWIRDEFSSEFDGWIPTIDRNQAVDGVHAAPFISIGADDRYPEVFIPTESEELPTADFGDRFGNEPPVHVGILDTHFFDRQEFGGRWVQAGGDPRLQPIESQDPNQVRPPWPHIAGHSTFIAGMIFQRASNALLRVRQVLDPDDGSASTWDVANAMMSLATSVQVLNLSFACFTGDNEQAPLPLRHAIDRLDPTTVILAAAGNHGANEPSSDLTKPGPRATMWPAAFDRVYAVGASEPEATFSPDVPWIRLRAPGFRVTSTFLPGEVRIIRRPQDVPEGENVEKLETFTAPSWARWSGTSFATAAVSGEIAKLTRPGQWGAFEALDEILSRAEGDESGIWGC